MTSGHVSKVPMTLKGAESLRSELNDLKKNKRPHIIQEILEARKHGDLRENAEYHAAKEAQGFIEGRIRELEYKLSHANIIDVTHHGGKTSKVIFGATVRLVNVDTDEIAVYQIVGEDEADLICQKISYLSPIARGLIGKEIGD